jgi:hypothetical protein
MKKFFLMVILLVSMVASTYFAITLFHAARSQPATRARTMPSARDIVNQIEKRIVMERPYDFGAKVEVTLPIDRGIRLKCSDNPMGLREFLICAMPNGLIYTYRIDKNGGIGGGGNKLTSPGTAGTRGTWGQREYTKWKVEGKQIRVWFQAKYNADFEREQRSLVKELNSGRISETQFNVQFGELVSKYHMGSEL